MGARFPPVPADDDLEVEGEDAAGFLREVALPHDRLDAIAEGTRGPRAFAGEPPGLVRRLRNLEVAAPHARMIEGGGVIVR